MAYNPASARSAHAMEIFLIAFVFMIIALTAMAVGWIIKGKALSGSCGGVDPDGRPLADCLCEMMKKPICESRKKELQKLS